MIQLFDQLLIWQQNDYANSPMEDSWRKFYVKFTEFRNHYNQLALLTKFINFLTLRYITLDKSSVRKCLGDAAHQTILAIAYEQGRPEKLRGPGQRVKVGPLTQVVR